MKYLLLIFIVSNSFYAGCQNYNFSLGMTYQPYFYKNYNKNDWNYLPQSFPNNPRYFNGFATGFNFSKPFSDHFIFGCELLYSKETQYYKATNNAQSDGMGHVLKYYYNVDLSRNFEMVRLPFYAKYSIEVGSESGLYLSVLTGGQISFLFDYKESFYSYGVSNGIVLKDSITDTKIRTPNKFYQKYWNNFPYPGHWDISNQNSEFIFKKFLVGVLGGIELSKTLFYDYLISIGLRGEYDFTNTEKPDTPIQPDLAFLNRPKTHNIRYGFTLSVSYLFGKR